MKRFIQQHKKGIDIGICSVCSAHPLVIEAALRFSLASEQPVLIEATSNQVNQFGGYTGMKPADFRDYVLNIAKRIGFPEGRLILGGDHLGPNCWQNESADEAMEKSCDLIAEYVKAGFTKIHLDASMSCMGDPVPLAPEEVARRAARLCRVAEDAASESQKQHLTYVIGTEVPVPGGESSAISQVHITRPQDAAHTIQVHYDAFERAGLTEAISRIIALVVQPGVEFDHSSIVHYDPSKAIALSQFIDNTPMVYEAHSTDYQTRTAYRELVRDHYAILKVGPALTFALREAIFALAKVEAELVAPEKQSHIQEVIDQVMLDSPGYWKKYYRPVHSQAVVDIHYSLSDRIRYYWPNPRIVSAMTNMVENLRTTDIPLGLLSQYLPKQFDRVLTGGIKADPEALIIDKIQDVLRDYAFGCEPSSSVH